MAFKCRFNNMIYLVSVLFAFISNSLGHFDTEPKCSKFDFEEKLLEKTVRMEHAFEILRDSVDNHLTQNEEAMQAMKADFDVLRKETTADYAQLVEIVEDLRWEEWGSWSACAAQCSKNVGERLQSRTRNKKVSAGSGTTQTESRPCSAVQFAGCIHPQNGDQFYAVAYDYQHVLAQATCAAMSSGGYVYAVKRGCSADHGTCAQVCVNLGWKCFNSLHVYSTGNTIPRARDDIAQKSLQMYKYNSCGGGCGPNFCCCIA